MASAQIVLPVPGGPAKLNASARPVGCRSPKPQRLKIRSCCVTCERALLSARLVAGGRTTSSNVRRGETDSSARRPPMPNRRAKGAAATVSPYCLGRAQSTAGPAGSNPGVVLASGSVVQRILTPDLQRDLDAGRELLSELRGALARFGATEPDISALDSSIRQLDELFLLVVVGEFNAGKSAFINAIAGQPILREGVTPTTARIHVLKHGDSTLQDTETGGVVVSTAPVELLRDVHIVDTPGTNAIIREHEQLTTHFVPRADLVLFVTSADRPFTETERAFFELIRGWGKKIVIVINKVDILERSEE